MKKGKERNQASKTFSSSNSCSCFGLMSVMVVHFIIVVVVCSSNSNRRSILVVVAVEIGAILSVTVVILAEFFP